MSPLHASFMLYRTTVRIDDELLAELKALAARQHRTLNSVMEEAFRRMLASSQEQGQHRRVELPASGDPSQRPLIDISPAGLKKFLEDEDIAHFSEATADDAARRQRNDLRPPA
jgi:ribbon-helix-helix CopG family protein